MTKNLKITFAQINPTVGAARDNANLILDAYEQAHANESDLLVCPEMALSGYVAEDLTQKPSFLRNIEREIDRLAKATGTDGPGILFGAPVIDKSVEVEPSNWPHSCWPNWRQVFNSAIYVDGGQVQAIRHKCRLPDDSIFDDNRVFGQAQIPGPMNIRGVRIAAPICEDCWWDEVLETQAESGTEIFISLNGSPWHKGKPDIRQQIAAKATSDYDLPFVYLNLVGGQDEIVFDGGSFCLNGDSSLAMQMPMFESAVVHTDWTLGADGWSMTPEHLKPAHMTPPPSDWEQVYECVLTGLRDYLSKNGFKKVILGLSGGIDSAITAVMAVDALGADNVHCVMMPSPYTSQDSLDDAAELATNLGVRLDTINIEPSMQAFETMLGSMFEGTKADTTEENVQSRTRGALLMAISNKFGSLVLTTGNKSEIAVGYATLYGDMC
ncbi:MAG: NAD+ synthase, partial [Alphaproteobacteria bacterium]